MMTRDNSDTSATKSSSVQKRRSDRNIQSQEKKIGEDEFMAAAIGDVEWLKQSIRGNRGSVNYDKNGLTPLHLAAIHGRLECLKLMIEKFKVDINLPSKTGWRPIHLVISNQTGKRAYNCLMYLLEKGANPSVANDDGITPMHQAASEGHVQCLKALIEAGAKANGVDYRGHKPIDLAKLWGHRKCARLLATEQWHQDKRLLAKEMSQLHKLQMQKTLHEIQGDEENKAHGQFNGEEAFSDWLQMHGLEPKPTGPREALAELKASKYGRQNPNATKGESLFKANSLQQPKYASESRQPPTPIKEDPEGRSKSVTGTTSRSRSPGKGQRPDSTEAEGKPRASPAGQRSAGDPSPRSKTVLHASDWNKSTKASGPPYIRMLEDFYPRDEYSMLPRPPARRQEASKEGATGEPAAGRPVVYKCKHIGDVHKKKHYDADRLPRSEVGMHLTADPNTRLFRAGLLVPIDRQRSWRAVSSSSSWSNSLCLQSVMDMMERMSESTQYYSIDDNEYDIHESGLTEVI